MDLFPIGFQGQINLDKEVGHLESSSKVEDSVGQSKRKPAIGAESQSVENSRIKSLEERQKAIAPQTISSQRSEAASIPLSIAVEPEEKSIIGNPVDPHNWSNIINQALESSLKYTVAAATTKNPVQVECTPVTLNELIDVETPDDNVKEYQLTNGMNINILGQPLFCQSCFRYFQTPDKLSAHVKLCHMKRIDPCGRDYPLLSSIKEESSGGGGGFSGAASTSSSCSVSSKEKPVSPSLNFCCTHCGKGFRTKDLLGKHTYTHEKSHTCEICFHTFSQKYHLVKHHEMLHRRPKPLDKAYHCVQCNKYFTRSRGLTKHTRIHTGEKLQLCPFPFCEKKFPVKSELNSHIRTHTGEKPFKCQLCFRSFAEKSTLKTHLYTHTGAKPYKCDYCDRRFNQHSTLKGHMFTHTHTR